MFPKEKLEQLNRLPQGILERLQEHFSAIYNLLMGEGDIDVEAMISRYKLLEKNGLLESGKISKDNFYSLMVAGEDKFSVISEILLSSTRKVDNIDRLISALPSNEIVRKYHDFLFDTLINNLNNDFNNISSQLNYVFHNRDGWWGNKSAAEIEASIEFAQKVVKDLIKRGDINEGEGDNKYLLSNLFRAIRSYRNDTLEFEQVKYESLMKNIDYKGAQKSNIINLYSQINGLEHLNIIDDLFNKSKFKLETIVKLNEVIFRYNYSEIKNIKINFL
jgi:polyhydroxyalkanoate synthesis regulator phasin